MTELKTPSEIIETLVDTIEKQRIKKKIKQVELCKDAEVPLSTYQNFIYKKKINLPALIKVMYTLQMWDNLQGLISYEELSSIDEMKRIQKTKSHPKRVKDRK